MRVQGWLGWIVVLAPVGYAIAWIATWACARFALWP